MARFTIELLHLDGRCKAPPEYFTRRTGSASITSAYSPIEADCFYHAVTKMWEERLDRDGYLPSVMRFQPNHRMNSQDTRMWMWGDHELIRVRKQL